MRANSRGSIVAFLLASGAVACVGPAPTPVEQTPTAVVSSDQEVFVSARVEVSGAHSHSPTGGALTFGWSLRARPAESAAILDDPTAPVVQFTADVPGAYVVELVVTTAEGASSPAACVVVARLEDAVPVAEAGEDLVVPPAEAVTVSGVSSADPLGQPLAYRWALAERPASSTTVLSGAEAESASFVPDVPGAYRVELVVSAGARSSAPDSVIVFADHPPVADAGPDLAVGLEHFVALDASTSSDADGDPLAYAWSLRSRPAGSRASLWTVAWQTTFTTDVAGLYEIDLAVSDWAVTDVRTITITAAPEYGHAPVAVLDGDQTVDRGAEVQVSAAASYDPDGDPISFRWRLLSRPNLSTADIYGGTVGVFTADQAGTYVVEVTAADRSQASSSASVTIEAIQQPLAPDVLDPSEVYLVGTLAPGASYRDALTHWSTPHSYNAGFDDYFGRENAVIHPLSGRIRYTNVFEAQLREYYRDGGSDWLPGMPYPTDVLANDIIFETPPCEGAVGFHTSYLSRFLVAPDGAVLHRCYGGTPTWYDESGNSAFTGADLVYLGSGELAMTADSVVDLATGITTPITGLPSGEVVSRRAATTGIWVVLSVSSSQDLWLVDAGGAATQVGTYPALPSDVTPRDRAARLDGSGALFQIAYLPDYVDVIVRRTIGGTSDIVYNENDEPTVQIHISSLVTGP